MFPACKVVGSWMLVVCYATGKFGWYLLFVWLSIMYYTYYGIMAVVLSPSLQMASVAATVFYAIWSLFAGFLAPLPTLPVRT